MASDTAGAVVTLGFDDGTAGHFDVVRPMLAEHNIRAVFFIISGRLGKLGYMTSRQVRDLHDAGHEIGGHSCTHAHLPRLSPVGQEDEIGLDLESLQSLGVDPVSFAYPFGEWDDGTAALVAAAGYTSARIVGGIASTGQTSPLPSAISLPVPATQRYALPTPGSVRRHHTAGDLQRLVEAAEQAGGHLQLVFHHIDWTEPVYGFAPTQLAAFLRWLSSRADTHGTRIALTRDVVAQEVPRGQ